MNIVTYSPPKSVEGFLLDENFISLICGPIGSTKTTGALMKIAYHASRMAPCIDGIRRSRCVWVRNTREQLRDTSIPDFLKWYPNGVAGVYLKTEMKFLLKYADVECEVLFRGLDDSDDVRRLLSLQASFIVFDEFREINQQIFEQAQGRVGRYPDKMLVPHRPEWGVDDKGHPIAGCVTDDGKPNKHVWGASNPPDMDTFWEGILTSPPKSCSVYIQPSAFDAAADWLEFLPANYYDDLADGKTQDWIDVYIHAKFGKSLAGQPVFRAFSRDIHVAKSPLVFNRRNGNPLLVGLDFGLTPTATIGQIGVAGQLYAYRTITSEGMGILRFCREKLKPVLNADFYGGQVIVIGDPAGVTPAQTDEKTVFQILKAEGFIARPARTNDVTARINAVDAFLTRLTDGVPGLVICPTNDLLVKALAGKYRYRLKESKGEEQYDDKPEKNHPWSDIADSFQYLCLHADAGRAFGQAQKGVARKVVGATAYAY
jgi:hypothetical protein